MKQETKVIILFLVGFFLLGARFTPFPAVKITEWLTVGGNATFSESVEIGGDQQVNGSIATDGSVTASGNMTAPSFVGKATDADKLDNKDSSAYAEVGSNLSDLENATAARSNLGVPLGNATGEIPQFDSEGYPAQSGSNIKDVRPEHTAYFQGRISDSAGLGMGTYNSTYTNMLWGEISDPGDNWNSTSRSFNVPITGYYLVNVQLQPDSTDTGPWYLTTTVAEDAGADNISYSSFNCTGEVNRSWAFSTIIPANQGEEIVFKIRYWGGGYGSLDSSSYNYCHIMLLARKDGLFP